MEKQEASDFKKSLSLVIVFTFIAKILGFVREMLLSLFWGASGISDAYLISQTIPGTIFQFVGVGLTTCFIPIFYKEKKDCGVLSSFKFTNKLLTLVLFFSLVVNVFVFCFSNFVLRLFAPGFVGDVKKYAIIFTRINITSLFFSSFLYVYNSLLQAYDKFSTVAFSAILYNICLVGAIVLGAKIHIVLLSLFSVLAVLIQVLLLLSSVHSLGYHFKLDFYLHDNSIKSFLKLFGPVVLGVSVAELNTLIDRSIASLLVVGGISALTYANSLVQLVQGGLVQPVVSVCYPKITKAVSYGNHEEASSLISLFMHILWGLLFPITAFFFYYCNSITSLFFNRGAFNNEAVSMTAEALRFYSLGIGFVGFQELLSRLFYSYSDTGTPMKVSVISLCFNVILNIFLSNIYGLKGLAIATSLSSMIGFLILYSLSHRKLCNIVKIEFIKIIKVIIITFVSLFGTVMISSLLGSHVYVFDLIVQCLLFALFYLGLGTLFKIDAIIFLKSFVCCTKK